MGWSATLDVKVDTVKNDIAKRTNGTFSAQEQVENLRGEGFRLRVRGEANLAGGAAQTQSHKFALGLAELNVRRHGRSAVRQRGTREHWVVPLAACLVWRSQQDALCTVGEGERRKVATRLTFEKSMTGSPPVPRKIYKNASGITSTVSS